MGLQMSNVTYGRGQAEWALWKSFTFGRNSSGEAPKVFKTRVKRLLDVDRDSDFADLSVPQPVRWSFVAPPEEPGGEAGYSEVEVFCLAVGLDLMDAGFKQSEVVFLLRYLRHELEVCMPGLVQRPSLISRQDYPPVPNLPTQTKKGKTFADARHFVVISKIEIRDNLPAGKASDHKAPLFLEPDYCDGIEELGSVLGAAMPDRRRVVTVVELTATAQAVAEFLPKAPNIRRGRPKA